MRGVLAVGGAGDVIVGVGLVVIAAVAEYGIGRRHLTSSHTVGESAQRQGSQILIGEGVTLHHLVGNQGGEVVGVLQIIKAVFLAHLVHQTHHHGVQRLLQGDAQQHVAAVFGFGLAVVLGPQLAVG